MTSHTPTLEQPYLSRFIDFLYSTKNKLDARGKPAWVIVTIIGFILFWPVGIAALLYLIFFYTPSKHYGASCPLRSPSTQNTAFNAYKEETLKRLEEEQKSFESFMNRLREAKDKAEFEQFMQERQKSKNGEPTEA